MVKFILCIIIRWCDTQSTGWFKKAKHIGGGSHAPDGLDLVHPVCGCEIVEARKEVVQEPGGPGIREGASRRS